ncbi:MAG: alcohol dehydrogenase catalytic domain-containing protein [Propionibacteriaceae bacterium]|jgi:threonine dehydrogenase-like Zn-dependent dehydrogenase|nr:alcohol dehydrogenase catalytic domain-containing protein [Propionibacteriaceae bacterium]
MNLQAMEPTVTQYAIQITAKDHVEINPEMPIPDVGPTQILLKIEACGICFSDTKLMHAFENHPRKTPITGGLTEAELAEILTYRPGGEPVVPGHEPVARIARVGTEVTRFEVGQRVLVQTDYRHIPTVASNAAFGYDFDGALAEYALVDERMVIDPRTDESLLIPVTEIPSSSAVALIEPWACVETAYAWPERQGPLVGGSVLVVTDGCCVLEGLDALIAGYGSRTDVVDLAEIKEGSIFDDIIYVGADADVLEKLGPHLANRGIMNIITCGREFERPVNIDVGRIHYDLIRYVGTTGCNPYDGYSWIPETCELRHNESIAIIGAAGPMGLMHTVRAATMGIEGITIDAVDVSDERLKRLEEVLAPIAAKAGVASRVLNSTATPLVENSYSYVALMVPATPLITQAVSLASEGAIINAFAGFAIGTTAAMDMNAMIAKRLYAVGTSGSRVQDMVTMVRRLEAGQVDTNISLDAITGIAGVLDAIESVNNRTSQGKIMVYPQLKDLGLLRLVEIPDRFPEVGALMDGGSWTKQAEAKLLSIA